MWKCEKCNTQFERLQIFWGTSGGEKVDVLDYLCPHCGNTGYKHEPALTYLGTKEEKDAYWDKEWDGGFETLLDGEPCKHPGCLQHVSHPCEGCGRIAGRQVEVSS